MKVGVVRLYLTVYQGAVAMDDWTVYRVTGDALDNLAAKFSKAL